MQTPVKIPKHGLNMTKGLVAEIAVKPGDEVKAGQILFTVETDKATLEVESEQDGTVAEIVAAEGEEYPVGAVVLTLEDGKAAASPAAPATGTASQDVKLPKHGLNMTKGLVTEIAVKPGDAVKTGQLLFTVETDKATLEVESELDGTVAEVLAEVGEEYPVGAVVLRLAVAGAPQAVPAGGPAAPRGPAPAPGGKVQATPAARKLAKEKGVDLVKVTPAGKVVEKEDVERFLQAAPGAAAPAASAPPFAYNTAGKQKAERSGVKKLTAERLAYSFREVPHFYLTRTVELDALNADKEARAAKGEKMSVNDYLVAAAAQALAKHPLANASYYEGEIWLNPGVNVGYAAATPKGLMVPVVAGADKLPLAEVAARRKALVQKALDGKIAPQDLEEGTFTITNLGPFGVDSFAAVVNPPQSAILAVGGAGTKLALQNGQVREVPVLTLTLAVDHRVLDGKEAAEFFATLAELLAAPQTL